MNLLKNKQKFFLKNHQSQISAIAKHPFDYIVATSDIDSNIITWGINSLIELSRIKCIVPNGSLNLTYSPHGNYLASLFFDTTYVIGLFDPNKGIALTYTRISDDPIRDIKFKKGYDLVTVGKNHLYNWTYKSQKLVGNQGIFKITSNIESKVVTFSEDDKDLTCCTINKIDVIVGNVNGKLQVWREYGCVSLTEPYHDGPILSIESNNICILTGGADGKINILHPSLDIILKIDILSYSVGQGI